MTGKKLKIVADENIAYAQEFFAPLGDLLLLPGRAISRADLVDADILLVRSVTQVDSALLAGSPVQFVGSCTIGTDHVDKAWLAQRGITFAWAPGCNALAVVEYVLSALQALAVDLATCRIGIVGCGNVGGRLLRRLQQAGVAVCGCDPFVEDDTLPLVAFDEILQCQVICLHTPLTRTGPHPTFHLLDTAAINRLAPGTVLLNAGRGAVVDNQALLQRLERQDLRVVLDVWENEPGIDAALLRQVSIGTPHIAGYSAEGRLRGTQIVYAALCDYVGIRRPMPQIELAGPLVPYRIMDDDAALRDAYPAGGAAAFDRLRKEYRLRRECLLTPDRPAS